MVLLETSRFHFLAFLIWTLQPLSWVKVGFFVYQLNFKNASTLQVFVSQNIPGKLRLFTTVSQFPHPIKIQGDSSKADWREYNSSSTSWRMTVVNVIDVATLKIRRQNKACLLLLYSFCFQIPILVSFLKLKKLYSEGKHSLQVIHPP